MHCKKLINSFEMKNMTSHPIMYLTIFFNLFGNNFLALLLCTINVRDILNMVDFLKVIVLRNTKILNELNFWLRMHVHPNNKNIRFFFLGTRTQNENV